MTLSETRGLYYKTFYGTNTLAYYENPFITAVFTFSGLHDTQHYDIQHKDTQHNDIQHNNKMKRDTQHNDSHRNSTRFCYTCVFMLSVANKPIKLSGIMLSVIMLSVVGPFSELQSTGFYQNYAKHAVPLDNSFIHQKH